LIVLNRFQLEVIVLCSSQLVLPLATQLATEVTGGFCTSGSEREFTLEGSWYADEEIQAGANRNAAAAD
jgi:hypothetical protein